MLPRAALAPSISDPLIAIGSSPGSLCFHEQSALRLTLELLRHFLGAALPYSEPHQCLLLHLHRAAWARLGEPALAEGELVDPLGQQPL